VVEGQPLFRLDSTAQEAAMETARRKIAEVNAAMVTSTSSLAEAEARITQARGALKQATDEYERRAEIERRSPGSISASEVERMRVQVETQRAVVDAAIASRDAIVSEIEFRLPAEKASAEASLKEAEISVGKTLVVAGTNGTVQQFALRAGDVVNPMLRPAGILVPERHRTALLAGFGQIEAQVIRVGMIGEVACVAKPWEIVPMVVTEVQNVIASGQVRPTDILIDMQQASRPGSITVIIEPLYEGQLDDLPQGGNCIANLYTSSHDALADPNIGALRWLGLHVIDTVGLIHALILRMQALLLPIQTLIFGGH
jgi:multidrug resistance efflux pump